MDSTRFEKLKKKIISYLEEHLKESRLIHTYNVVDLAVNMAQKNGEDVQKAELAALLHDAAKYMYKPGVNMNLAHSKMAVDIARSRFEIDDIDILNAISYHTTGRAGMSMLEKIIFLADAIEPGRTYSGVDSIRKKAESDIDGACLLSLRRTADYIRSKGNYLDPDTLEAIKYLEDYDGT